MALAILGNGPGKIFNIYALIGCQRCLALEHHRNFTTTNITEIKRKEISKWKNQWPTEVYFEGCLFSFFGLRHDARTLGNDAHENCLIFKTPHPMLI